MAPQEVVIRPLRESDLADADRIMRVAFGTFLGLPDPATHLGNAGYARSRWTASPDSAFAAEIDGRLIGSNFATRWGSFGFFGPLSIDPSFQDRGYGAMLIDPVIELFNAWGVTHRGLFTFAQSPKHIGLYQKFGFRPRALTAIMERAVGNRVRSEVPWTTYSRLNDIERATTLEHCRRVTNEIYRGLDITPEVQSLCMQSLGDTVLVGQGNLDAFAACHIGKDSEAESDACYIKFGAAASGVLAGEKFRQLLGACDDFAAARGLNRIVAGVSAARTEAYEGMLSAGFRVSRSGVAMHYPNEAGFSRPGAFVIDDWR